MLKAKKPARRKTNKRRQKKTYSRRSLLILLIVLVSLPLASYIENRYSERQSSLKASAPAADTYKNLDLAVARTAAYTNGPVTITKDLGIQNGVRNYIVKFQVPKDNLTEYGYMTLPLTGPVGKYPVILLCHGYVLPAAYSTSKNYLSDMVFYSQQGYAVIKPDFRGQGLSLNQGSPEGAFFSMAYNTDLMSLIAAVKQTDYLDRKSINLWGHSMGAYIALRAAVVSPDVRSAVLLSLPGDMLQDARMGHVASSDKGNYVADKIRRRQLAAHGSPLENQTFWDKTLPINYLGSTKAYFQIHIGSLDRVTVPSISAMLDAALTNLNKPHGYFIYTGSSHALLADRPVIWQRSLSAL